MFAGARTGAGAIESRQTQAQDSLELKTAVADDWVVYKRRVIEDNVKNGAIKIDCNKHNY